MRDRHRYILRALSSVVGYKLKLWFSHIKSVPKIGILVMFVVRLL